MGFSFGQFCNRFSGFSGIHTGGYIMMGIGLLVIIGIIYLVYRNGKISINRDIETPLELLKKRFVNGELDEAEYLKKKDILEHKKGFV